MPEDDERREQSGCDGSRLSDSFRLTHRFLELHPRYRQTLSLTPEHHRFDPVLWHSSTAALRALLQALADDEGLSSDDAVLDRAVANLIEGIVKESKGWGQPTD